MQQAVSALESLHLNGLAHIAVIPCARQNVLVAGQGCRLYCAECARYDRCHLGTGEQTLCVDLAVGAVQQAVVDGPFQRLGRPVIWKILELAQVSGERVRWQEHCSCQQQGNGLFTFHSNSSFFVSIS